MTQSTTGEAQFERWPGYNEQSWAERFATLDQRYSKYMQDMASALMAHARAVSPTPEPAPEYGRIHTDGSRSGGQRPAPQQGEVTPIMDKSHNYDGVDCENAAWDWLDKKFGTENDDPVDRAYDASEMVDAFHAGAEYLRPAPEDAPQQGEPVAMSFRERLVWAIQQARYNHDAFDSRAAEIMTNVLEWYDALSRQPEGEG